MRTLDPFEIWQCIQHILTADNNSISYGCLHYFSKDLVVNCLKLCQAVTGWAGIFHLKERKGQYGFLISCTLNEVRACGKTSMQSNN